MNPDQLREMAEKELGRILSQLPDPVRKAAMECPVQLLMRPESSQCEEGEEGELLGLFEGASRLDSLPAEPDLMPRISLFLQTIFEEAEENGGDFPEEVKVTYLH